MLQVMFLPMMMLIKRSSVAAKDGVIEFFKGSSDQVLQRIERSSATKDQAIECYKGLSDRVLQRIKQSSVAEDEDKK